MQSIRSSFKQEFETLISLNSSSRLLVAVSGGVDSMVLCDLLLKTEYDFSIAHCNFQLRKQDSDNDEKFVVQYCKKNNLTHYTKKFNVKEFKQSGNYSTQMAARNLRYLWFQELIHEYEFDFLLTAHHLNDSLETFLINLSRGTGIDGLTGIKSKSQNVLRPLLSYSKEEILKYANDNNLLWREDRSNSSIDYTRNKIRHKITPILNEIHPNFLENFAQTIQNLNDYKSITDNYIDSIWEKLSTEKNNIISIQIEQLKDLKPLSVHLFHLFKDFKFTHPYEIEKLINSSNNGEIRSETHRLIKNRTELHLVRINENKVPDEINLEEDKIIEKPLYLRIEKSEVKDSVASETLDFEKIEFPLRIRKVKVGDTFTPLGMKGKKKLLKFFKDEKYSKLEKENAWLLVDAKDKILYLIGKRIAEPFKCTEHTHKYLNIYLC